MQRRLTPEVLDYADKSKLLGVFIDEAYELTGDVPLFQEEKEKIIDAFLTNNGVVQLPLSIVKLFIKVETCLDKCLLFCLHPHINYVALSKSLMSILDSDVTRCFSDEVEQAMITSVQLSQAGSLSAASVKRFYEIFRSRRSFGEYNNLIAKMIVAVYLINEGVDPIPVLSGNFSYFNYSEDTEL